MKTTIRPLAAKDRSEWEALFAGYADFYHVAQTPEMRGIVWAWLHDPAHETQGRVADQDGILIGLAHFRAFARPLTASTGGFLDDLFVTPTARGSGAAAALIDAVKAHGAQQGWGVIRWITAENNYRARGLYDQVAQPTVWKTYDIKI